MFNINWTIVLNGSLLHLDSVDLQWLFQIRIFLHYDNISRDVDTQKERKNITHKDILSEALERREKTITTQ